MTPELCGLLREHQPHPWELLVDDHQEVPADERDRWCHGTAARSLTRWERFLACAWDNTPMTLQRLVFALALQVATELDRLAAHRDRERR